MADWTTSHDRVLAQRNAEGWMFLLEAVRDLRTTGAVAPSGRTLARLLTDPVQKHGAPPLNVLEVGAGTGSVTRTLIPGSPGAAGWTSSRPTHASPPDCTGSSAPTRG